MKTFGSDPELMLFRGNRPHSAIGVIDGDIDRRIARNGHQFYCDNVLAECAVRPASDKESVIASFGECLKIYTQLAHPYELKLVASADFPADQLLSEGALRVGCAVDDCAYDMEQKESPVDEIVNGTLRSCGGHVHVGAPSLVVDGPEPILFVYMMDLFLGVPSLWLDKDPTSPRRRALYGQAGRYRTKDYGIEYRSLGNFWLESPRMVGLVYDLSMFALDMLESGRASDMWKFDMDRFYETGNLADVWQCVGYDRDAIRQGINKTDKSIVQKHLNLVNDLLPSVLSHELETMINRKSSSFYENWSL